MAKTLSARSIILAGCAMAALATAFPAVAQQAPPQEPAATAVDDIVVTARRREEVLQDVPIAVSAFTAETMEERQIETLVDVARYTPGVQIQQAFGRDGDRPVIRGASNILISDGKVGVFLDGIPWFGDFSTLDLDAAQRVEVIRGPQSAVFGRGTLSGAINVVTQRPGAEWSGRVSGTYGTDDRIAYGAYASGPIAPWLGVMAGYTHSEFGGQYRNGAGFGEMLGATDSTGYYAGLFFTPTPDVEASIRYFNQEDDDAHFAVALQPSTANNCFLTTRAYYCGDIPTPTSFALNTDRILRPGLGREAERILYDFTWDVNGSGWIFSYAGSMNEVYEVSGYDQSYDNRDFFLIGAGCPFVPIANRLCGRSPFNDTSSADRETSTNEFRISSPAFERFSWNVGAYMAEDELTPLPEYLEATEVGLDALGAVNNIKTSALFGGLDVTGPDMTLSLELRWQQDEVTSTNQPYVASTYFDPAYLATLRSPNPAAVVGTAGSRQTRFENILPRVTFTWERSPDTTLYAQYAKGNSPGGFNDLAAPQTTYDEETLSNWEVGAKTRWLGFDYLNAALFFNVLDNQVLTNTFFATTVVQSFRANIGETQTLGFELEGAASLTDNLSVRFAYSYLDGEITEGVDGDQAVLLLGAACKTGTAINLDRPGCRDAGDISGKRPPLVSEHLASAGIRYESDPMFNGFSVFGSADVTYRGEFFEQVHNNITIPASTRMDLQLGIQNESFRLSLWGRNVFDDDTPQGVLRYVDFPAPVSPSGDRPRAFAVTATEQATYGVSLTARF